MTERARRLSEPQLDQICGRIAVGFFVAVDSHEDWPRAGERGAA